MASPCPCRSLPRLAGTLRLLCRQTRQTRQSSSSSSSSSQPSHHDHQRPQHDPYALLSKPTWSVRTLLPPSASRSPSSSQPPQEPPITPDQLSHLLRLSALPQPADDAEARRMLADLDAQLHFVRDVQRVDTDGVDPLPSIRDETPAGLREATVTVDTLRHALAEEDVVGRCRRPRRRRTGTATTSGGKGGQKQIEGVEDWDVLGCAAEKVGRYFVVRSGKGAAATSNGFVEGFGGES